jgi:hypothetical protein
VILDEPFSGLDPVNAQALKDTVVELRRRGKTVIFSTHLMDNAERLCDAVCIVARGEKVLDGGVAEVKAAHGGRHIALGLDRGAMNGRSAAVDAVLATAPWSPGWTTRTGSPSWSSHPTHPRRCCSTGSSRPGRDHALRARAAVAAPDLPRQGWRHGRRNRDERSWLRDPTGGFRAAAPSARAHAMQRLAAVVRREFGERVRTRWFLFSTLLGPVFFAALTILPAWLAMRERASATATNITVVDATGAGLGVRVARALADSAPASAPRPQLVVTDAAGRDAAERAAVADVTARRRVGVLVLDSATLAGRRARYAGRNASSIGDVERIRDVVRRETLAVRLVRAGLDSSSARAVVGPRLRLATERLSDAGRAGGSGAGGAIVATAIAFLLYMLILLYGQNVLRSVLEEKTTRVAEVVVASVKPDILMAGKVLGVGAVGLLQQAGVVRRRAAHRCLRGTAAQREGAATGGGPHRGGGGRHRVVRAAGRRARDAALRPRVLPPRLPPLLRHVRRRWARW